MRGPQDWLRRRDEIGRELVEIAYGRLPPVPAFTGFEILCQCVVERWKGASYIAGRIHCGPAFSFLFNLLVPPGPGPFPVVLNGDACWRYASDEVCAEVLERGYILAQFNRTELAADVDSARTSGLYPLCPEKTFGALSAWAWGYHRGVDVLAQMDCVRAEQIAVIGHSRGGKAVLLAAATDERIALTGANNSGAGGAGCFRVQGLKSETLADCLQGFPHWFGPRLQEFVGRESDLPFDQHFLKALIAPRALLSTEAHGDLWGNPAGTWQTYRAAREVYRFLGAEDKIGIVYREGRHSHLPEDWFVFLDFLDWHFLKKAPNRDFSLNPFPELAPAHDWAAPAQ